MSTGDAFQELVERAVEAGVRKALSINQATNRRLLSIKGTAVYLDFRKREIEYMAAEGELQKVKRGTRTMFDIQDLDRWIARNKG